MTTVVVSIARSVTGPPPGVVDPESVAYVYREDCCTLPLHGLSTLTFGDLRDRQVSFTHVAAFSPYIQTISGDSDSTAFGEVVTGDYFNVLGVKPAAGRLIQPADDRPDAPVVMVLSHQLWRRLFDSDVTVVGRTVRLNGEPVQVVGIAPVQFRGLINNGLIETSAWVSWGAVSRDPGLRAFATSQDRTHRWLRVVGRLRRDVALRQAAAQVVEVGKRLDLLEPSAAPHTGERQGADRSWAVRPATSVRVNITVHEAASRYLVAIYVGVAAVLFVSCANVAGLMLAWIEARRFETAVTIALGATPWRVLRPVITETIRLVGGGSVVGLSAAWVLLQRLSPHLPVDEFATLSIEPSLDVFTLGVGVTATAAGLLAAGVPPGIRLYRADCRPVLSSAEVSSAGHRWIGRKALIGAQATVSAMILTVGAAFAAQMLHRSKSDQHFDLDDVAVLEVDLARQRMSTVDAGDLAAGVMNEVRLRPSVDVAAMASGIPAVVPPPVCATRVGGNAPTRATCVTVSELFFATGRLALLEGRLFTESDRNSSVAILNSAGARRLFGRRQPLGELVEVRRQRMAGDQEHAWQLVRIVGVVADRSAELNGNDADTVVYVPYGMARERRLLFLVRPRTGSVEVEVAALRAAVRRANSRVSIARAGSGWDVAPPERQFARVAVALCGWLGACALVVAIVGLQGLVAEIVARRGTETAVRLALGSSVGRVTALLVWDCMIPVVLGVVLGSALAWLAMRSTQAVLAEVSTGPLVHAWMPLVVVLISVATCYLSARKAAASDISRLLRR